ncbi:hypothetical protein MIV040R [Invertebrate iridescent virus 3]|uniref:Uncharacterized protein 040R n=1 Tax=Invertebrate iridescent virus 3 TaxID=345201 RepID=040R_IIV3|nr:hypothetical protein MIV040R [Invertebrate iridescent virus 3]Q197C0.1 RecName: Full=Uncharacterized protein 040R [Invertebrate iridescent virus 3]ABF82070.1 hypothetical protein MIV040R [Invertebrate iridescent virus 3]
MVTMAIKNFHIQDDRLKNGRGNKTMSESDYNTSDSGGWVLVRKKRDRSTRPPDVVDRWSNSTSTFPMGLDQIKIKRNGCVNTY